MESTFILGDKLPLRYDVAIAIHSVTPSVSKVGTEKAIYRYATAVRNMWIKAFTQEHVISLTAVKARITSLMKDYNNKCYKTSSNTLEHQIFVASNFSGFRE